MVTADNNLKDMFFDFLKTRRPHRFYFLMKHLLSLMQNKIIKNKKINNNLKYINYKENELSLVIAKYNLIF